MNKLLLLRGFITTIFIFTSGVITGWWLFHHYPESSREEESPYFSIANRQPDFILDEKLSSQSQSDPQTSEFEKALIEQRLDDALIIYQQKERENTNAHTLKNILLALINQWATQNDYSKAINTLERFTQHYFQDQDYLVSLSKLYLDKDEYIKAIDPLLSARSFLLVGKEYEKLSGDILKLAKVIFNDQAKRQGLEDSLFLFQKLTMLEPDQGFYRYALVESYLAVQDTSSAIAELEILQHDPEYRKNASRLLLALQPPPEEESEDRPSDSVPLLRNGKHYIVSARLQNRSTVSLMLDTGATYTTLQDSVLLELKRRKMAHRVSHTIVHTANGSIFTPIYQVKELTIGHFVLKNIEVAGLDSTPINADGLLGMNALRHFHFHIDQDHSQLIITPR